LTDLLGYLRDFLVAVFGLAAAFGVHITQQQTAGILLVVSTAFALGSYLYTRYRVGNGSPAGKPR
jgi:hypothetical protein